MHINLGDILQDAEIGMEVIGELEVDAAELKLGQPVAVKIPRTVSIEGVECDLTVTATPKPSA